MSRSLSGYPEIHCRLVGAGSNAAPGAAPALFPSLYVLIVSANPVGQGALETRTVGKPPNTRARHRRPGRADRSGRTSHRNYECWCHFHPSWPGSPFRGVGRHSLTHGGAGVAGRNPLPWYATCTFCRRTWPCWRRVDCSTRVLDGPGLWRSRPVPEPLSAAVAHSSRGSLVLGKTAAKSKEARRPGVVRPSYRFGSEARW
jgi:hypothetical protein